MAIYMIKSAPNSNSNIVSFKHDDVWDDLFAIGLQDLSLGYEMDVNLTPNVIATQFVITELIRPPLRRQRRDLDLSENSSYSLSPPIWIVRCGLVLCIKVDFPQPERPLLIRLAALAIRYSAISVIYDVTLCGDQGVWGVMDGTGTGTTVTEDYVEQTTPDILYGQLSHCYNLLQRVTRQRCNRLNGSNVMRGLLGLPLGVNTPDWGCGTGRNNPTPKPKKKCFRLLHPS